MFLLKQEELDKVNIDLKMNFEFDKEFYNYWIFSFKDIIQLLDVSKIKKYENK